MKHLLVTALRCLPGEVPGASRQLAAPGKGRRGFGALFHQLMEGGDSCKSPFSPHKPKAQLAHPLPVHKKRWEWGGSLPKSRLGLVITKTQCHQKIVRVSTADASIQTAAPPFSTTCPSTSCTPQASVARQLVGAMLPAPYHLQAAGSLCRHSPAIGASQHPGRLGWT